MMKHLIYSKLVQNINDIHGKLLEIMLNNAIFHGLHVVYLLKNHFIV
jgi:hypothetical protein